MELSEEAIRIAEMMARMGLIQTQTSAQMEWADAIKQSLIYTFFIAVFAAPITYFLHDRSYKSVFTWLLTTIGICLFVFFAILIGLRNPAQSNYVPGSARVWFMRERVVILVVGLIIVLCLYIYEKVSNKK